MLIETSEREKIVEIITTAGYLRDFYLEDEDVTETWRKR